MFSIQRPNKWIFAAVSVVVAIVFGLLIHIPVTQAEEPLEFTVYWSATSTLSLLMTATLRSALHCWRKLKNWPDGRPISSSTHMRTATTQVQTSFKLKMAPSSLRMTICAAVWKVTPRKIPGQAHYRSLRFPKR